MLTVARIAYQASDVIVSVQPSLALDSEFSSHLKRYCARKERSLVAKNVEAVPEVRLLHPELPLNTRAFETNGFRLSCSLYDTMPTPCCPSLSPLGMAAW